MHPSWNRLLLQGFGRGCCCGSVEVLELGWLRVVHLWDDDYLRLPTLLDFFDFVAEADDEGLRGYGLLEVLLLW